METVARNAGQALAQHKLRRAGDLTTRSKALEEIAEALGMETAPLRIECYDVSQIQGTDVVASMVVFEDGLARKSEYRRFAVKRGDRRPVGDLRGAAPPVRPLPGGRRRASSRTTPTGRASIRPPGGRASSPTRRSWSWSTAASRRSTPPPRCSPSWASPTSRCAGWPSGWRRCGCPTTRSRSSCRAPPRALYLLQRVRDEAHRFAITFHRERRSKRMTASTLDAVPGPGRDPAQGAADPVRLAQAARGRRPSRRSPRSPASAPAPPRRSSPPSTPTPPPPPSCRPSGRMPSRRAARRPSRMQPFRRRRRPDVTQAVAGGSGRPCRRSGRAGRPSGSPVETCGDAGR